jgi:signal transduction histidine kinase
MTTGASTDAANGMEADAVRALSVVATRGFSNVREASHAIFGLVHELVGMRVCVLTRIELASNTLTVLEVSDKAGLGIVSGATFPADQMPCECVVRLATALREHDLGAHPAFRGLPARTKLGLRSYIGVPLSRSDGTIWGTLAATDTELRETTDAHLQTLAVLARLAMFELEREEQRLALAAQADALAARLAMAQQLEKERLRAVRLEAVLEAAATVSHEVNNPLTVLQLRLVRIKKRCRLDEAEAEAMDDIEAALEAAGEIERVTIQLRRVVRPVSTRYVSGTTRMLDLAASVENGEEEVAV